MRHANTLPEIYVGITSLRIKNQENEEGKWIWFFLPHLLLKNYHRMLLTSLTSLCFFKQLFKLPAPFTGRRLRVRAISGEGADCVQFLPGTRTPWKAGVRNPRKSLCFRYRLELGWAVQAGLWFVFCTTHSTKHVHLAEAVLPTKGKPWAGALLEPTAPPGVGEAALQELSRGSACVSSHLTHTQARCRPEPALRTFRTQAEMTRYWQSRLSLEEYFKDQEFWDKKASKFIFILIDGRPFLKKSKWVIFP